MSDVNFEFSIQGDSEGYVMFDCPYCGSEFKLNAEEFQSEDNEFHELFCPYCGLANDVQSFYTDEVIEAAKEIATNYMIEQLNKSFGDMARKVSQNKYVKMTFKPLKKVNVRELADKDTVEEVFQCNACDNHMKVLYCAGVSKIYCPYCGVDL